MSTSFGMDRLVLIVAGLGFLAVIVAALAARPKSKFRVPSALLFLALGMVVGSDGLGLIDLDDPALVRDLGIIALLAILFEGGLTTKPTDIRLAALPGFALSTVGVVITAGVTGLGAWLLLDIEPLTAALIGSVVASTDAAAVFSMMRTTALPRKVSAVLRIESGANDPIAVMLTIGVLATFELGAQPVGDWVSFAALQLGVGVTVGVVVGLGGVVVLRRLSIGVVGLYPVLAAAIGGIAYGTAATLSGSGFIAIYVAGVLVGTYVPRHRRDILGFHEAMANAAEIGLFLLLGLLVFPSRLSAVALSALAVAAVLIIVARPLAVWLCTLGASMDWRHQGVITVAGLRGAVPIVLATFPLTAGHPQGGLIFDIVFFVVLVSVLVQGSMLVPVTRWLGLDDDKPAWAPVAEALPLDVIDIDLIELFVTSDLAVVGRLLAEVPPPERTRIVAVVRDDKVLIATGETRLTDGDVLLLASQRQSDALEEVTGWARGEVKEAD
ncbi:MAG: potassium/proton antiporter [Nitriliruptoraceae bacterium]